MLLDESLICLDHCDVVDMVDGEVVERTRDEL